MKLQRDIGVTQKTAWYMLQRLRKAWEAECGSPDMTGTCEVDETYMGGLECNKHADRKLAVGGGTGGKTPALGVVDRDTNEIRAKVATDTGKETVHGFRLFCMTTCTRSPPSTMTRPASAPIFPAATSGSSIRWVNACAVRPTQMASSPFGRC